MNPQSAFSDDWKSYKLSEIITLIGGGTPKTTNTEYWGGDIPWLSVKDFNNDFRYVYTTEKTITRLGLEQSSTTLLQKDDIIISARGTVGETAMIPYPMAFNQSCYGIRAKWDLVDSIFLYYLLKNSIKTLKNNAHGSVFDTITRDTFDGISIALPPLPIQKKIAAILSSLDDKIEQNTRMNKVLEEIARALFQRWFVAFEFPDAEGKPYKSAGGKMVESEMGMVPEGWRVGTIGDVVKITSGKRPLRKESELSPECNIPILGASSVMGYTSDVLYNEPILVTGRVGTHGIIQKSNTPCWPSDNTLVITSRWYEFAYQELLLVDYKNMNRGSTQPLITQGDLKKILIILPSETNMNLFESMMSGIASQINLNIDQSGVLSNLRDNLLPKLVSGEIEI